MRKAIIPVAGVGSKLRPHTHTQPKPMMPVAGKPILGHIIDSLIDAGITHHVFVLGYLGEKIREYVENEYADAITMDFVVQEPRRGLAEAVILCKQQVQDASELIIILGDTIFGNDVKRILLNSAANVLGVQEVDDPRKFGICATDAEGMVTKVVEKPEIPMSNLAMVGLYKIQQIKVLLESIDEMLAEPHDKHYQFTLTEAIANMMQKGISFQTMDIDNWYDCGNKDTLLKTNRILLQRQPQKLKYHFENSVVIPPVNIAAGCKIHNSIIGPYVAIAENTLIENSVVKDSIIGAYSHLDSIILNKSVLGNDTMLKGKAHSINIGDSTEIDFDE